MLACCAAYSSVMGLSRSGSPIEPLHVLRGGNYWSQPQRLGLVHSSTVGFFPVSEQPQNHPWRQHHVKNGFVLLWFGEDNEGGGGGVLFPRAGPREKTPQRGIKQGTAYAMLPRRLPTAPCAHARQYLAQAKYQHRDGSVLGHNNALCTKYIKFLSSMLLAILMRVLTRAWYPRLMLDILRLGEVYLNR